MNRRVVATAIMGVVVLAAAGCAPVIASDGWGVRFTSCMNERGWNAELESDGGVTTAWTDAQEKVYKLHSDVCSLAAGGHAQLEPEEYRGAHDTLIANRDCIVAQGHRLPDPPNYQDWIDGGATWSPYDDLPESFPTAELHVLIADCPPAGAPPVPRESSDEREAENHSPLGPS